MNYRPLGLGRACALLALCVFVAFCVIGFLAYTRLGLAGLTTAGLAASLCWLAATLSLMITGRLDNSAESVGGMLIANSIRFGVPLSAGVMGSASEVLAANGLFGWIVLFYLLTLACETTLSVLMHRGQNKGTARIP